MTVSPFLLRIIPGRRIPQKSPTHFVVARLSMFIIMFFDSLKSWKNPRPSSISYVPLWAQYRDNSANKTEDASSGIDDDENESLGRPLIKNSRHCFILFLSGLACGFLLAVVGLWLLHKQPTQTIFSIQEFSPASRRARCYPLRRRNCNGPNGTFIVPLTTVTFTEHSELFDRPSPETEAAWEALIPGKSFGNNLYSMYILRL